MILIIDNFDSFVHNIARYFEMAGARTSVVRNDVLTIDDVRRLRPDAIVISPGPGTPDEAGISNKIIEELSGAIPILGICLGHQCLGVVFGARLAHARYPMHGLSSDIIHNGRRLFEGLPSPLAAGRYHSLIVEATPSMREALTIDARSVEGEVMALSHKWHPTYSVQFHPESILTPSGAALLEAFWVRARDWTGKKLVSDVMA